MRAHRASVQPARASNLAIAEEFPPRNLTIPASGSGARARRATRAREAHDGWTFVLIPPGAGALPRALRVSVRRLRMATAALVAIAGTAVVSGSLLAVLLSMAPTIQPETAGVRLGVLGDSPPAAIMDSAALFGDGAWAPVSLAAAASAAVNAATNSTPATSGAGPGARVATAKPNATSRRRVIEPPSMSGRRASGPTRDAASVAEASAHGLPVSGRITSRFSNARTHPLLGVVRRHNGVDIAAPSGTPITAAAAGRVIFAGRKFGFGNTVEIDHGNGIVTRYAHARSIKVRGGARVESGKTIATVGRTGLASGPHLHFEVLRNGVSVDPLKNPVASLLSASSTEGLSGPGQDAAPIPVETPATVTDSLGAVSAPDSAVVPPTPPVTGSEAPSGVNEDAGPARK